MSNKLPKRSEDFSLWYNELVKNAQLADNFDSDLHLIFLISLKFEPEVLHLLLEEHKVSLKMLILLLELR